MTALEQNAARFAADDPLPLQLPWGMPPAGGGISIFAVVVLFVLASAAWSGAPPTLRG